MARSNKDPEIALYNKVIDTHEYDFGWNDDMNGVKCLLCNIDFKSRSEFENDASFVNYVVDHTELPEHKSRIEFAMKLEIDSTESAFDIALHGLKNGVFVESLVLKKVFCTICETDVSDSLAAIAKHAQDKDHRRKVGRVYNCTQGAVDFVESNQTYYKLDQNKVDCLACKCSVMATKVSLDRHDATDKHKQSLVRFDKYEFDVLSNRDFNLFLVLTFASNNIPIYKFLGMKYGLEAISRGQRILDISTLRQYYLKRAYELMREMVVARIAGKQLWISMDETTKNTLKVVVVMIGTLCPDDPASQQTFMWDLHRVDSKVETWDYLKVLRIWDVTMRGIFGESEEDLANGLPRLRYFVSDGGSNLIKAANIIMDPNGYKGHKYCDHMLYMKCLVHGIHNVCQVIQTLYPLAIEFCKIVPTLLAHSESKAVFFKEFRGIPRKPPSIVETRWCSSINAMDFHYHYLEDELATFQAGPFADSAARVMLDRAIELGKNPRLAEELAEVHERYGKLSYRVKGMESMHLDMKEQFRALDKFGEELDKYRDSPRGLEPYNKYQEVFYLNNPGYLDMRSKVESEEERYQIYRLCPAGSYDCERAFAALMDILTKKRQKLGYEADQELLFIYVDAVPLGLRYVRRPKVVYDWVNEGLNEKGGGGDVSALRDIFELAVVDDENAEDAQFIII